jgi:chloramphenicol-sensitive protein RarD
LQENEARALEYRKKTGYLYGIAAFTAWGLLPVFWKLLQAVSPAEILAHRIIWSFIFVTLLLIWTRGYGQLRQALAHKRSRLLIGTASLIISLNWFTYIWAVNSNFVVQASMGYYINPLVVAVLSITVVKEKLNRGQCAAFILAFIGVAIMTYRFGSIPWVALTLAVTFALYGLIKKFLQVEAVTGLALETLLLTPFALGYLIFKLAAGTSTMAGLPLATMIWLVCSGAVTATPLVWFAKSAQRIEFASVGFLQYIAPTITLMLGIFLFKEDFNTWYLVSFSFIWAALAVYSFATFKFDVSRLRRGAKQKALPY